MMLYRCVCDRFTYPELTASRQIGVTLMSRLSGQGRAYSNLTIFKPHLSIIRLTLFTNDGDTQTSKLRASLKRTKPRSTPIANSARLKYVIRISALPPAARRSKLHHGSPIHLRTVPYPPSFLPPSLSLSPAVTMRFHLHLATAAFTYLLTSATAAETTLAYPYHPAPYRAASGGAVKCTGGTFDACMGDVICAQSFPESCFCQNNAKTRCASACGVVKPELQKCG
ncbi:hypothetical protein L873DRAFT_304950 [Choiromyces venosus 120613-1]|uniref:Uncharacterized protein n=1 Tax=Choiromyces venosus 120613-1 TaxID=1336337 RepID=A0A3N4J029_9PEZI|nr:hypothetical protein L873DRAFT_304950 [Choiromyces venosus 120613-1]